MKKDRKYVADLLRESAEAIAAILADEEADVEIKRTKTGIAVFSRSSKRRLSLEKNIENVAASARQ